jgi:exodeoxyribonuclease VII large subunit
MSEQAIYTVSQINRHIQGVLKDDKALQGILVEGEISNYKRHPSGHHYFSLKDSDGTISCVMYRWDVARLKFRPENGMKIVTFCSVDVYLGSGQYQLKCQRMMPAGLGDLQVAFEQLKEKLDKEGLFAPAHKKPIPTCPNTIAVITSDAGAAVFDLLRILNARWPMAKVKVMGVQVQGDKAPKALTRAVEYANRWKVADVIIIGRGGGSMESLWAFNDEGLARAIYDSEIPVISAVGHEPDVVISDYVADLRAATPSNAAELAVPDQNEVYASLEQQKERLRLAMTHQLTQERKRLEKNRKEVLQRAMIRQLIQERQRLERCQKERLVQIVSRQLTQERQRLERCKGSRQLTDPRVYLRDRQLRLDGLERRLVQGLERNVSLRKEKLARTAAALDAMSPLKVLGRGYSLTTDRDGQLVTEAGQVQEGDSLNIQLKAGSLRCSVIERSLPDGK